MQLKRGAHAPSRAVLCALAEHISCIVLPKPFGESEQGNQRAGAPAGTREGACAPGNNLNRSGLAISMQKTLTQRRRDTKAPERGNSSQLAYMLGCCSAKVLNIFSDDFETHGLVNASSPVPDGCMPNHL